MSVRAVPLPSSLLSLLSSTAALFLLVLGEGDLILLLSPSFLLLLLLLLHLLPLPEREPVSKLCPELCAVDGVDKRIDTAERAGC